MKPIAQNLKELREARGITREKLAKSAHVNSSTILRLENGQLRDPKVSILMRLAEALSVPLVALCSPKERPIFSDESPLAHGIVGQSNAIRSCFDEASILSKSDEPLLITGETGTGKELFARYIHALSNRRNGPFIPINCGALVPGLVSSELFGYTKGAFTDAVDSHEGSFERAGGGTVYLDEIGTLPIGIQPVLLRVIQDRRVARIGEAGEGRTVDVRFVASTNEDIGRLVESGMFRTDLYYRIQQRLTLPPLRERPSDIPLLIKYFESRDSERLGIAAKIFAPEALSLLCEYEWPGNIRQLQALIHLVMISTEEPIIDSKIVRKVLGQFDSRPRSASQASELFRSGRIPYYFGPPVSDSSRFFGRKHEIGEILQLVEQGVHGNFFPIAIIGDHRLGKSSLLRVLDAEIPVRTRALSTYVDLASVGQDEFFETIIRSIAELAYAKNSATLRHIKEAFDTGSWKSVLGEVDIDIMGFLKIKKSVQSEQDWKAFKVLLERLRSRFPNEVSSVVIIVDEVSTCASWQRSSHMLRNWRSLIQNLQGYNFVVADAQPLHEISKGKFSAFFNVFTTIPLGPLKADEADELISVPGASVGVTFTPEASALIRHLSSCKPYYIQIICCSICEWLLKFRADTLVSATVVDVCTTPALRRLGEHFSALWGTLTTFQKTFVLDSLASRPTNLATMENPSEYERQRHELKLLRDRQIMYVDGNSRLAIEPLLAEWLDRFYVQSSAS
jgi:transcriptional regulator with AAA-type ATPase domain